ncbi:hypothetical protein DPMN_188383 [Dreissena polymorpha]|uniref:Uncharacterized protein n=1 Tax=Dreissena polymorpha TaxID=45954 RepID=A0A9D4DSB4_DREPO|nr:hypothetical protein DPMN_188383 [Dreissena polymorpha]
MEKPRLGWPPTLTQSARKRQGKASYDKKKVRTIDMGDSLEEWTRLKNENKCTESELVKMLIASYAKTTVSAKEKRKFNFNTLKKKKAVFTKVKACGTTTLVK